MDTGKHDHLDYIIGAANAYTITERTIKDLEHILQCPRIEMIAVNDTWAKIPDEMSIEVMDKLRDILSDVLAAHMEAKVHLRDYLLGIIDEEGNSIEKIQTYQ